MKPFALAALLLALAACSSSNSTPGGCTSANAGSPITSVTIQDFDFSPSCFAVAKGSVVTFTNSGSSTHTVTTLDGPETFDSMNLNPGGTYQHTYGNTGGTSNFHCKIHPSMTATAIIE
jgi:plastocyanin